MFVKACGPLHRSLRGLLSVNCSYISCNIIGKWQSLPILFGDRFQFHKSMVFLKTPQYFCVCCLFPERQHFISAMKKETLLWYLEKCKSMKLNVRLFNITKFGDRTVYHLSAISKIYRTFNFIAENNSNTSVVLTHPVFYS